MLLALYFFDHLVRAINPSGLPALVIREGVDALRPFAPLQGVKHGAHIVLS